MINNTGGSYYSMFLNVADMKKYKGTINIQIEELIINETLFYCENHTNNLTTRRIKPIENNFWIQVFTSGCYYYDLDSGIWSSDGTEVLFDSNFTHTHCVTSHLTNFASGFFVLPVINIQEAFANASFEKNPIVYILIILLLVAYALLSVFAYLMDKKDKKKINSIFLTDKIHLINKNYFYELTLFTGTRKSSETDSQVILLKLKKK